jgi:CBS domain-containing protein
MNINEIMTPHPQTIGPDDPVSAAAEKMKEFNVGILPVCNGDRLVGVLTDRDIAVRAVANGLDPDQTLVRTVMSRLIMYCFADQDETVAASMMETNRIRRLPVLDHEERLVGVVSLGDLAARTHQERLAIRVLEHIAGKPEEFMVPLTHRS